MDNIKMFEHSDCQRTQSLLDDFLSGELSVEANQFILSHLEICERCQREKGWRKQSRAALKRAWNSQVVPARLGARIREIANARGPGRFLLKLAAGFMVPILALLVYSSLHPGELEDTATESGSFGQVENHYRLIVADHINCQGHPAEDRSLPLGNSIEQLKEVLLREPAAYRLVSVQECDAGGAHFIHYVFEGTRGRLSLAIQERRAFETLPGGSSQRKTLVDGVEVLTLQQGTVALASMKADKHFIFVLVDDGQLDTMLALTERMMPSFKSSLFQLG